MKNILNHFIVLFLGLFPAIAWGQGMYINFHDGTSEFQHLDNVKKLKVENDYSDFNDKLKFYFYAPDSHRNCLTLGPSEQTIECKIYTIGNDGHHTYNRKLHIDQPWIRVDDIDGEVMTISVKRNLTDKIRVGTIKLTEENKKSVYDVLTIKQGCNGASDISGTVDGHEYVDLGLPSGLLWAKLNVGAARPGERGGHFAFGETETRERDSYTSASYWDKFKPAGGSDLLSFIFPDNDQYAISYYPGCPDGIGFTEYDVAHVKWGGGWRMPTDAECDELLKYCYRTVIWQDECYGYEFRSLINGNTLFIPFAGFYDDVAYYGDPDKDAFGWYWTSTISESRNFDDGNATHLMIGPRFADDGITMLPNQYNAIIGASTRFTAGSVRPVLRPWDTPEPPVDYHIVPSLTDLRCQWQGEVVNVSIDANCEWTFSSQASWLTVEKTSDKQLTVSVSENTEASSRETEIKLYAVNNPDINASISVNQANKEVEPSGIYAILHHNGNSTVYYSETALQQAYDHAVNSDAIELSAGEFLSVDIQKSLTIRGVGWKPDNEKGRSTISGDFKLATNGTNGMTLTVRGVYNDGTITYGAGVSKVDVYDSRFYNVEPSDDTPATDFSFVKSKVQQLFRLSPKGKARFENSFIYDPHSVGGPGIEFVHSVIFNLSNELYNCRFVNSIIDCCLTVALDASNSISYCLSIGGDCTACFDNMDTSTSLTIPGHDMFKTFRAWGFTDEEDYQLTDEAASQYIGSDGTQIGINGGQHPYISNE